jgi:transcriptional regulator with XRE-family HTH domain
MSSQITSEVIRAARMLVRWDQKALAEAAGVSHVTVRRLEAKPGPLVAERPTIAKLRVALELAGVIFVDENGEGPGVRLRKSAAGARTASIPLEDLNAENDE